MRHKAGLSSDPAARTAPGPRHVEVPRCCPSPGGCHPPPPPPPPGHSVPPEVPWVRTRIPHRVCSARWGAVLWLLLGGGCRVTLAAGPLVVPTAGWLRAFSREPSLPEVMLSLHGDCPGAVLGFGDPFACRLEAPRGLNALGTFPACCSCAGARQSWEVLGELDALERGGAWGCWDHPTLFPFNGSSVYANTLSLPYEVGRPFGISPAGRRGAAETHLGLSCIQGCSSPRLCPSSVQCWSAACCREGTERC